MKTAEVKKPSLKTLNFGCCAVMLVGGPVGIVTAYIVYYNNPYASRRQCSHLQPRRAMTTTACREYHMTRYCTKHVVVELSYIYGQPLR